jgi:GntR family transcriptional repressor for pyruvate dehydrogenase complex
VIALRPLEKLNLYEIIVDRFVSDILSGELEPGQKLLPEVELASQLNVSRNMLREAMKTLEVFGIIESRHGTGTFLSEFAKQRVGNIAFTKTLSENHSLSAILETRVVIEPGLARFAAERRTDEDIQNLERCFGNTIRTGGKPEDMFHLAIARASKCELLEKYLESLFAQLLYSDYAELQTKVSDQQLKQEVEEHRQLLDYIIGGNGEATQKAMYKHLTNYFKMTRALKK